MAKDTFESHDEYDVPAVHRDGLGNALVICTTIVLLVAIYVIQKALGDKYQAGMFGEPAAVAKP